MTGLLGYLTEHCCEGGVCEANESLRAASMCSDAVLPPLSSTQEALKK